MGRFFVTFLTPFETGVSINVESAKPVTAATKFFVAAACLSSSGAPGIASTHIGFKRPARNIVTMFSKRASLFLTSSKTHATFLLFKKFTAHCGASFTLAKSFPPSCTSSLRALFTIFCVSKPADPPKFTLLAGLFLSVLVFMFTLLLLS